jgi:hypothetical protein
MTLDELNAALSSQDEYKRLVQTATDLTHLANIFPQYKDQLIQPVIR